MITLHSLPKAILHIDCDAFFASVEQAMNPHLRGKPVITGKERGIASSLSYEAKARGVKRGMRLFEIQKICPECVILPSDYETYSLISKRLFEIVRRFTPDVEEYSIDECFAEISGLRRVYRTSYEAIALRIKHTLERELGITVSVGLSLSKSLAKLCSKFRKPAGFTCVKGYDLHHFLGQRLISEVCGFGPSSTALLAKKGIHTVLDYVERPKHFAKKLLGKVGEELWHELRGEAVCPLVTKLKTDQASLSKAKTFTPPSTKVEFVRAQLMRNVESAFIKLRRHKLRAKTLGVFLKDQQFHSDSIGAELTRPTSSTLEVVPVVAGLFEALFKPNVFYRQTGVFLTHLSGAQDIQYDFFEDPCRLKNYREIASQMDSINARYGKHSVHLGATDCLRQFSQHLGERGDMAQRKSMPLKGENVRQHIAVPVWNIKV